MSTRLRRRRAGEVESCSLRQLCLLARWRVALPRRRRSCCLRLLSRQPPCWWQVMLAPRRLRPTLRGHPSDLLGLLEPARRKEASSRRRRRAGVEVLSPRRPWRLRASSAPTLSALPLSSGCWRLPAAALGLFPTLSWTLDSLYLVRRWAPCRRVRRVLPPLSGARQGGRPLATGDPPSEGDRPVAFGLPSLRVLGPCRAPLFFWYCTALAVRAGVLAVRFLLQPGAMPPGLVWPISGLSDERG